MISLFEFHQLVNKHRLISFPPQCTPISFINRGIIVLHHPLFSKHEISYSSVNATYIGGLNRNNTL